MLLQRETPNELPVLLPTLQLGFYTRLQLAESEFLLPALLSTVKSLNITELDRELAKYAGAEKLALPASQGLRGELIYPVPLVLINKPSLLGYYRLLLGFSQKEFYRGPFSKFSPMENRSQANERISSLLPGLCKSLSESSWILASGIKELSQEILNSLTLITYGSQLRGGYNNILGQKATQGVFERIRDMVKGAIESETPTSIQARNAAGRPVIIEFSPDPDIAIHEQLASGRLTNRIAIEIKQGGKDISNIHNRLGEAEKSHQKAKKQGFTQFWTLINVEHLDLDLARRESPTTTKFFVISEVLDPKSSSYSEFQELLLAEIGLA